MLKALKFFYKESINKHGLKLNNRNVGFWKASRKSHRPRRVPRSHECKKRILAWVPRAKKAEMS